MQGGRNFRSGNRLVWSALLLLVLAAGIATSGYALEAGSSTPDVAAPVLDGPGTLLRLSSLRGKVLYVDFWASWCVPCARSLPALDSLYGRFRERGFVVVGVNKDVEAASRDRFLRRYPVAFPLLFDAGDSIARAFEVKAMPSGYLIDRSGIVRHVHRGFTDETGKQLAREIEALLERP